MPKKKHKSIPLTGATKILRAHSTQIEPPGLLEMSNLFLSRSDNSMGLRSDWQPNNEGMFSYASLLQGSDKEDYLNAAFYVDRAGHTIWFGRQVPFTWDGGFFGQLFTLYEEGTIATDGVKSEVIGSGTEWLQQIWPGCLIRQKGEENPLYTVTIVSSDTRLVTDVAMPGISGAEYEIFRTHPASRADWPIKMASLGGFLVYGTVDMEQPLNEKRISGPFYSNIGRPNLGVWFGTDPEIDDIGLQINTISVGWDREERPSYWELGYGKPILVGGQLGAIFGKNWFGDVVAGNGFADTQELHSMPTGTNEEISYISQSSTSLGDIALTLSGSVIPLSTEAVSMPGGWGNVAVSQDSVEATKPFGEVPFYGAVHELIFGGSGTLGELDGTQYATSVDVALRAGAYFGSYVIVGDADITDAVILYFSDPNTISRATSGITESLFGVAYSPFLDLVVAVGQDGVCLVSSDQGATWSPETIGSTTDLNAVASDEQGRCFCAVGLADAGVAQCYVSMDGSSWDLLSGFDGEDLVDVRFNHADGAFYTATSGGKVYRIRRRIHYPDGSTTIGTFGTIADFVTDVKHDGTRFVAVGNKIWSSLDGITWFERLSPPAGTVFSSVAKDEIGGLIWVAVGEGGVIYRSVNNGVDWLPVTSPVSVDLNEVIFAYVPTFSTGDFIAVGKEGKIIRSQNGTGWALMTPPTTEDLYTITTDYDNPGVNDANLYLGSQNSIYICHRDGGGTYTPWATHPNFPSREEFLAGATSGQIYQDLERSEFTRYNRQVYGFNPSAHGTLMGLPGSALVRAARLVNFNYGGIEVYENLDQPMVPQEKFHFLAAVEWYNPNTLSWQYQAPGAFRNCIAIAGAGTDYPVIVIRVYINQITFVNGGSFAAKDGYVTSTDWGITWSTERFQNFSRRNDGIKDYGLPQNNSFKFYKGVDRWQAGGSYAPICSDGTDIYIVHSSTGRVGKPTVTVLGSLELTCEVEEVE